MHNKKYLFYSLFVTDLTEDDAEEIVSILKLKKLFPLGDWSDAFLIDYLYNFWDWDTSEYVKEKLLKKNGLHKRYVQRKQGTIKNYWLPYFSSEMKLADITKTDLKKFILSFSDKQQPASAKGKNDVIRSGLIPLKLAFENELIPANVTLGLQFFSDETPERFILDEKIISRLFSIPWENAIAELANKLALVTGLRAGEIQALRQCDILENALKIEHSWNSEDGLKITKAKKSRKVFIPFTDIMTQLKNLADSNPFTLNGKGYIFYASIPNKPQDSRRWLDELKKELAKRNEEIETIEKVTFHGWRHFFTTYMRRNGLLDDQIIQQITGHKSSSMLYHYSNHCLSKDSEKILSTTKNLFEPLLT